MVSFTDKLLAAADDEAVPFSTQVLLRRAATRLEGVKRDKKAVTLHDDILAQIDKVAAADGADRAITVNAILRDWLIGNGHVPFDPIEEDTDTKGSA